MNPAAEYHTIKSLPVIGKLKALNIPAQAIIKNAGPKLAPVEQVEIYIPQYFSSTGYID